MKCEACEHENIDNARFCAKCGALLPTESHSSDPLIGQLIGGRYRVTEVLGEGGMGVVYVGEQQMGSTVRRVAIKTLHQHLSKDPSVLARFHRECGTVAQLEHPNTIKFYDFGSTSDGTLYIAMEFVDGRPLSDVIEQGGPIAPERVVHIMRQVCGALDEAHQQGIVHRDLKPENVVLTDRAGETDFVKVLDFGIAARTESADAQREQKLTQQGMVLGTPPYMSPEQFTGKPLDSRSDIYSLGVMAYEMLTGRLPFDADTPWQWATEHMTAQPLPFEASPTGANIPPEMRTAILKSLSKNKEERQETAREFFTELSEGGRMTLEHAARASGAGASTGTAAMEAAPAIAGGPGPTAPGTAPGVNTPQAFAHVTPGAQPATPAGGIIPPPPPPMQRSGGGKGLLIGLSAIAGVLVLAIGVVLASTMVRGGGGEEEDAGPLLGSSGTDGTTSIAPEVDAGTVQEDAGATPPADDAGQAVDTEPTAKPPTTTPPKSTGTKPPPAPDPKPPPAPDPKPPPDPKPEPKPDPKPPAGDPCDECIAAASGGNFSRASNRSAKCKDAAKKAQCQRIVREGAPLAARQAALNEGNCKKANSIANAARAMGAGSGQLNQAVASCKKKGD